MMPNVTYCTQDEKRTENQLLDLPPSPPLSQELMHKMTSTYGDGQLDLFDWLPLFAIILAAALIFNSLIPASVLGRGEARKDEDALGIRTFN